MSAWKERTKVSRGDLGDAGPSWHVFDKRNGDELTRQCDTIPKSGRKWIWISSFFPKVFIHVSISWHIIPNIRPQHCLNLNPREWHRKIYPFYCPFCFERAFHSPLHSFHALLTSSLHSLLISFSFLLRRLHMIHLRFVDKVVLDGAL